MAWHVVALGKEKRLKPLAQYLAPPKPRNAKQTFETVRRLMREASKEA